MKILMTSTVQGSLDGVTVQRLDEDVEYDATDRLARYHIKQGVAVQAPAKVSIAKAVKAKAAR